jgi:hypothetical protein
VELQLKALQEHSRYSKSYSEATPRPTDVNNGIRVSFSFASPENRAMTGPLERFAAMAIHGYGCLVNCRAFAVFPLSAALARSYEVAEESSPEEEEGLEAAHFFVWVHFNRRASTNDLRFRAAADNDDDSGGRLFLWSVIRKHREDHDERHLSGCWLTSGVVDITEDPRHCRFMSEVALGDAQSYHRYCQALRGVERDVGEAIRPPTAACEFSPSVFREASENGDALSAEVLAGIRPLPSSLTRTELLDRKLRSSEYWG